jgi:hypothetical protein
MKPSRKTKFLVVVGQAKPMMARKRAASTRAMAKPAIRGRPRHSIRSTYASPNKNQDTEEPPIEDQTMVDEEHLVLDPTPEQVLHQL